MRSVELSIYMLLFKAARNNQLQLKKRDEK